MRPFPYDRWPRVTRDEANRLGRCARRLPLLAEDILAARAASLLGAAVHLEAEPLQACPAHALLDAAADPLVAAVIDLPGAPPGRGRLAMEIDPRLAACIIDRALGGEAGESIPEPATALGDVERGVLAYVIARVLADATNGAWHLRAVVTTPAALLASVGDAGSLVWPVSVRLGADAGAVRAWIPEALLATPAPSPLAAVPAGAGHALGRLRLTLSASIGHALLTRDDLDSLRPSDVLVPDRCTPDQIRITLLGARRTTWNATPGSSGLTITTIDRNEAPPMTQGHQTDDVHLTASLGDVAGDAPVELQLEIAHFTMPLEEIAALRPGAVLSTRRPIGSEVTLRAGDRVVATGELVDVEGEVGVRLLRVS